MREEAYRLYITETIYQYVRGNMLNNKYTDIIEPKKQTVQVDGDEVVEDIMTRHGLRFKE